MSEAVRRSRISSEEEVREPRGQGDGGVIFVNSEAPAPGRSWEEVYEQMPKSSTSEKTGLGGQQIVTDIGRQRSNGVT